MFTSLNVDDYPEESAREQQLQNDYDNAFNIQCSAILKVLAHSPIAAGEYMSGNDASGETDHMIAKLIQSGADDGQIGRAVRMAINARIEKDAELYATRNGENANEDTSWADEYFTHADGLMVGLQNQKSSSAEVLEQFLHDLTHAPSAALVESAMNVANTEYARVAFAGGNGACIVREFPAGGAA